MATTAGRLVGGGLALAAVTIVTLAILVLVELEREARLQRDVILQIEATERIDTLREGLSRLGPAVRIAALTGSRESRDEVEALAAQVERDLATLAAPTPDNARFEAIDSIAQSARLAILNARSLADSRGRRGAAANDAARETEALASEAAKALERVVDSGAARLNRRALAQIRAGESMRRYVSWTLAGSVAMLSVLFELYRRARRREHSALARIQHMAHYDGVTGLPNRTLLSDRLEQEVARAHRSERPFALLSFDLDGFKEVNDTWGHAAGDAALQMVAMRARDAVRASDTVGRQGGDEFLALLPETALDGALHVAEKVRAALAEPYLLAGGEARMSASLGIALFPAHGSDATALQRAADAALYEAKRDGRNRVKVASRAPAPGALEEAAEAR